ncbi:MAG: YidC/Oxa1 family insertase periplasmic-domain containing protein [Opitutaceae bacterium]|nr:YidC/Oxa1 family insertase periplasmic-domain containing protein [Opitutaceae bacterium]
MDKKNMLIGGALMVCAIGFLIYGNRYAPPPPAPLPPPTAQSGPEATGTTPASGAPAVTGAPLSAATAPMAGNTTFAAIVSDNADAKVTTLRNEFVEVRLTDFGGAVLDVAFRKYPAVQGEPAPFVFNQLHADPMLAFIDFPGLDRAARFSLVSSNSTEAVYQLVLENRIEVTRRYKIFATGATLGEQDDPYEIRHETTFRNLTDQTIALPRAGLSLGTAAPVNANDYGLYLNVGFYDGDSFKFNERSELEGGGFLTNFGIGDRNPKPFIEQPGSVVWATVKNQFFAAIFTLDQPGVGILTRRVELPPFAGSSHANIGVSGAARIDLKALAPKGSTSVSGDFYVGPKEYKRLAKFEHRQDKVMQFDRYFFNRILLSGYVGPFLLTLMHSAHSIVPSWGWSIVLMTLFLKIITLPFTLAASRASKRMQKLQPQIQAVREKYKDNPQKLNQATMEIFKENKVNPVGGCLPILITIPLFVGFFAMLQSASELRFAPFLWAADLSAPDTVAHIFGFPLNIMPLLMGATMVVQMRLTPTPTTDNMQMKIMQFMPIMFTFFCYTFSCALALYSTVNGLFTIVQQLLVNKFTNDEPVASAAAPKPVGGNPWKKAKNVTPKKK